MTNPRSRIVASKKELAFLRTRRVARLETVDERGRPHVVPVCYVFDGKDFYSPIDKKSKKVAPIV